MKPSSLLVVVAAAILQSFASGQIVRGAPHQDVPEFIGYVEDELIVVLDQDARRTLTVTQAPAGIRVDVPSLQSVIDLNGVIGFERQFASAKPRPATSPYPDLTGHYKVRLGPGRDLDVAVQAFEAAAGVDHVEKIGMHSLYQTANDPYYQGSPNQSFPYDQWHLWDTHSIDADQAWDSVTGSSSVLVGILDSGTRYFHVDLGGNSPQWGPGNPFAGGNVFINQGETPGNGSDDDNNGFVDDTIGWDFVASAGGGGVSCIDQDCSGADNDPDDGDGHGTHTSGTVGAITNNGILVSGIAGGFSDASGVGNGVKIVPLRIGYHARYHGQVTGIVRMDYAAQAMNYLAGLVDAGHNVAAINCSWGSSNSGGLDAAVNNLLAHDVMVVHAAGNANTSSADYLGNKAGVMNVAATDINGNGASFTSYGSWVDVAAPGVDIVSLYRNPDDPDPAAHYIALLSGTSMSAPHVVGIAALLESCTPSLTGPQKFSLITGNVDPYSDSRNLGSGIANAKKALDAAGCSGTPCDVTADFSASTTSGCVQLAVGFTDLSTGTGLSAWAWDFGDGGTSSLQDPTHTYTAAGNYTVSLTTTGATCADSETKAGHVAVSDVPIADFSGSPTVVTTSQAVSFSDSSSGNPTSWLWDFGDFNSSTAQSPSHTYASPGSYTVTLTATNVCGSDGEMKAGYITVTDPPDATDMFVFDIVVTTQNQAQGFKRGVATITIHDNAGSPVQGATVTGDFSGKTTDIGVAGATNASGQVVLLSSSAKGGGEWCFAVTDVEHATLTYNQITTNNVTQSCQSGDVF